jgi:hypothetical protein
VLTCFALDARRLTDAFRFVERGDDPDMAVDYIRV